VLNLVFETNWYKILEPRGGNVASLIVSKFGEATESEISALMAAGVVLFIVTLIVNMLATSIVQRSEKRMAS
jgi:phosphate transport system permease protein